MSFHQLSIESERNESLFSFLNFAAWTHRQTMRAGIESERSTHNAIGKLFICETMETTALARYSNAKSIQSTQYLCSIVVSSFITGNHNILLIFIRTS